MHARRIPARFKTVTMGIPLVLCLSLGGCTAVLGDFTVGGAPADAGGDTFVPQPEGGGPDAAPDVTGKMDGGVDSGVDAPVEAAPVEAGPAGKAGLDLVAGGTVSKSAKYKLIGAVGESPGGNTLSASATYKLKGGIVAATQ